MTEKKRPLFFDRHFKNNDYEIFFNTCTGIEILQGVNGKPDPFYLEYPSLLDIGIMGTCKNKCYFCYQGHEDKPNMKLEDLKKIIDQSKYHVNQVALGGRGDPNKHESFKDIIEYCKSNKVVPNYTTSGIDLTDEEIEISKMCGAVAVSAYNENHTYEALNKFIKADIKTNIHMIFSSQSYEKIIDILEGKDIWYEKVNLKKLNAIIFLLFKPQGAGKKNSFLIPTEKQLKHFSHLVYNSKAKFQVGLDSCLVNKTLNYETPSKTQLLCIDTCEGARMSSYISPDMKFMPCSFADHDKWAVQITNENDIKKIWNESEQFINFRKELEHTKNHCPLFF